MKLSIHGAGQKYTVDMHPQECEEWFKYLVGLVIFAEQEVVDETDPPAEVQKAEPAEVQSVEVVLEKKALAPTKESKRPPAVEQERTYKGFLYIECPDCHETHGFHSKYDMTYYRCKSCGHKSDLPALVPLYVKCQCGRSFAYQTNKTEPLFDINCLECGCPVPVEYNAKAESYKTIEV